MESNNQPAAAPEAPRMPTQKFLNADEYKRTLPDADTPEEFLRKLQERGSNVQVPEAPREEVKVETQTQIPEPKVTEEVTAAEEPKDLLFEEPVQEEIKEPESQESPNIEEETDGEEEEKHSLSENYKKLKTKHKETRSRLKEIEEEANRYKTTLEEYDKGVAVPEIVKSLETRVNELSKYEKIHNFLESQEYKDHITTPFVNLQNKFFEAAETVGIEPEIMEQVLSSGDKAHIHAFLRQNFDEDTAYSLRQGLKEMDSLSEKAIALRKGSEETYQQLKEQSAQAEAMRIQETVRKITDNSKVGFNKALQHIQEEKRFMELIPSSDDPDFNERFVKPLTMDAARSFGRFINEFAKLGIKDLPLEVAQALARTVQLAHVAGSLVESRNAALKGARELAENTKRSTSYERPPVGVKLAPTSKVPQKQEIGGTKASMDRTAESLIETVIGKR